MSRRAKGLMLILIGVLGAGFFYLRALARLVFHDVSHHPEEAVRARLSEEALQSATSPSQPLTLYFPSPEQGRLLAEIRSIPLAESDPDRIRQILLALVEGSRLGQSRALPPSTDIRAVFLTSEGTAYVDFSNVGLSDFAPGIASETLAVYSIVSSLTANIPAVKKVKILVQGQEVETLDGHVDLSDYFAPDPARLTPVY